MERFTIATGDPFDGGINLFGVFNDADEAARYAESLKCGWCVIPIHSIDSSMDKESGT